MGVEGATWTGLWAGNPPGPAGVPEYGRLIGYCLLEKRERGRRGRERGEGERVREEREGEREGGGRRESEGRKGG